MTRMRTDRRGIRGDIRVVGRWPSCDARRWTEQLLKAIERDEAVLALVATGSAVRSVEASFDLDLLLVFDDSRPSLPPPPLEIDLRTYRRSEIEDRLTRGNAFLGWAVKYGRPIFERGGYWSALQHRWRGDVPLPSVDEIRQRAARAERLHKDLKEMGDADAALEQLVTLLTHRAWEALVLAGVYPASRPELPAQLTAIGADELAMRLSSVLDRRARLVDEARSPLSVAG